MKVTSNQQDTGTALKLQGKYVGTMRGLPPAMRARVKRVRARKGIRAAIAEARRLTAQAPTLPPPAGQEGPVRNQEPPPSTQGRPNPSTVQTAAAQEANRGGKRAQGK